MKEQQTINTRVDDKGSRLLREPGIVGETRAADGTSCSSTPRRYNNKKRLRSLSFYLLIFCLFMLFGLFTSTGNIALQGNYGTLAMVAAFYGLAAKIGSYVASDLEPFFDQFVTPPKP